MTPLRHSLMPLAAALVGWGLVVSLPAPAEAQRRCRVVEVIVLPSEQQVTVGATAPYAATAYDQAGNVCDVSFNWMSSNRAVATIDPNGIASALAAGVTTITARTGTGAAARSGAAVLSVTAGAGGAVVTQAEATLPGCQPQMSRPPGRGFAAFLCQPEGSGPAFGLLVEPPQLTLVRGESQRLQYRSAKADGSAAERVPIVFDIVEQGGDRIVTVDTLGVVTARPDTAGRVTVRASVPGRANIQPAVVSVEVRNDTVAFARGEVSLSPGVVDTVPLRIPAQSRNLPPSSLFRFTTSDTAVVRVSPFFPRVEAVGPGRATITALSPYYRTQTLMVNVHRPVADVRLTPATEVTIAIGNQITVGATAVAADGSPVPEAPLTWTPPDSTVVRFDAATKVARGLSAGTTQIRVRAPVGRDSSVVRTIAIRVVAGGLRISRNRVGLGVGERTRLSVELLDDRRQVVGPATGLTWTSGNDSVATVADGEVSALRSGRTRITARAAWDSVIAADVWVLDELVVSAQRGGAWDLWMMSGTTLTRPLTRDSAIEVEAAYSPDLTRVAFVASPGPGSLSFQLFVADADGGNPRQLTTDTVPVGGASFVRPAGDRIVFHAGRPGQQHVYVIGVDGAGRRALTSGADNNTEPSVSPDGTKLLFASARETSPGQRARPDIYEMNLDGTGTRQLTVSPRADDAPQYAGDGGSVYFLRDDGGSPPTRRVYRLDLTTRAETPLTPLGTYVRSFSVSADGNRIALTILGADGTMRSAVFDVTTQALTPLPAGPGELLAAPTWRPATPQPQPGG